jgi:hypothetical protein
MVEADAGGPGQPPTTPDPGPSQGERRWPMALAVMFLIGLPFLMPAAFEIDPRWILPILEGVLLIAIIVADPGRIDRRSRGLRRLTISLIMLLVLSIGWATARLIYDLVTGSPAVSTAGPLLTAGATIWVGNAVVFAILYWELDSSGPAQRAHEAPRYPDFAFQEQLSPSIAPPGWRATFVDYLYVGFTNATAFSPTDTMPLAHWAKITMTLQSLISLTVVGLVIARAVNILT